MLNITQHKYLLSFEFYILIQHSNQNHTDNYISHLNLQNSLQFFTSCQVWYACNAKANSEVHSRSSPFYRNIRRLGGGAVGGGRRAAGGAGMEHRSQQQTLCIRVTAERWEVSSRRPQESRCSGTERAPSWRVARVYHHPPDPDRPTGRRPTARPAARRARPTEALQYASSIHRRPGGRRILNRC